MGPVYAPHRLLRSPTCGVPHVNYLSSELWNEFNESGAVDLGLETTAGVLSLESGTSSQSLSYVALSHRTGLRSLSWRCLWTTCSFWPGLQICSLGLCLSWPTFRHLSSSWPRAAKRSSESSCYHCSFAKMSDKASGVCSLNVWWNSLGKSFGSGPFFGGSFLINNLVTCYNIGVQVFC